MGALEVTHWKTKQESIFYKLLTINIGMKAEVLVTKLLSACKARQSTVHALLVYVAAMNTFNWCKACNLEFIYIGNAATQRTYSQVVRPEYRASIN